MKKEIKKYMIYGAAIASLGANLAYAASDSTAIALDCASKHRAQYDAVVPAKDGFCIGILNPNSKFNGAPDRNGDFDDMAPMMGALHWLNDQTDKRITRIGDKPMMYVPTANGVLEVMVSSKNYVVKYWDSDKAAPKLCTSEIKVADYSKGIVKIELLEKSIKVSSPSNVNEYKENCVKSESHSFAALTDEDRRILRKYGSETDKTNEISSPEFANSKPDILGRETIEKDMMDTMASSSIRSVLLWGPPGTGKTSIAYGLGQMIARKSKRLAPWMKDWAIYSIASNKLSEEGVQGKSQAKMAELMGAAVGKKVILFFDEIHQLIGMGAKDGANDITEGMKTALAEGNLCVIGTLTGDNSEKGRFDAKSAFQSRFKEIFVDEPTDDILAQIFRAQADKLEASYNVHLGDDAIQDMITLTRQYSNGTTHHPRLGEEFLNALAQKYKKTEGETYAITSDDIKKVIGTTYNVESLKPVDKAKGTRSQKQKALDFETDVRKVYVGQETAVKEVRKTLIRYAVKGAKGGKPPVFLFMGPSGVGKTYLAQLTAQLLFAKDGEKKAGKEIPHFHTFDMNGSKEFGASGLSGSAAGWIGSDEGSPLKKIIDQDPESVLNFDEIDKTNSDTLQYLMTLFDEGTLQDAKHNEATFKGIIFLTSNFGMDLIDAWDKQYLGLVDDGAVSTDGSTMANVEIKTPTADDEDNLKKAILDRLENPDPQNKEEAKMGTFVTGRIGLDNIVIFHHLNKDEAYKIAKIEVQKVLKENKEDWNGAEVKVDDSLVDYIAKQGYSFRLGARVARSMAENLIINPVAEALANLGDGQKIGTLRVRLKGSGRTAQGVVTVGASGE